MDFGYVIKRSDDDFVINVDPTTYAGGYNVVPKSVDPYNIYNIDDVRVYIEEHPEKIISIETIENYNSISQQLEQAQLDLEIVNAQLFDEMIKKVLMPGAPMTLDETALMDLLSKWANLKQTIDNLKVQLQT